MTLEDESAFKSLRDRAEKILKERGRSLDLSDHDLSRMLREFETYQIELELQNEELQRAEKELASSRNEYLALFNSAPVAYITLNAKGLITRTNRAAREMFDRDHLIDSPFSNLIHPEDHPDYFFCLHKVQQLHRASVELRLMGKWNKVIYALLVASTEFDKELGSLYWHFAISDITRQKEAEIELQKSYNELERHVHERTLELNGANESLRQREGELAAELEITRRLQQLSTQMIEADEIESLYEQILDTSVAILQADFASIQIFYPDRGKLRLLGHRGFSPRAAACWEWVGPDSRSASGEAMRTGQRVVVPDVRTCGFMAGSADLDLYLQMSIRAVQTTPLLSRNGTLLGMLSTHWREPHELSESALRALDILMRQAADLIYRKQAEQALRDSHDDLEVRIKERTAELEQRADQLARLSSELTLSEQRERSRIAEILHDHLQQLLVGAKIGQEILIVHIDDALKQDAERVLSLIIQSIMDMRSLSTELSPPILRSGDFTASLRWLAKWMYDNQRFEVRFQSEEQIVLDRKDLIILLFQSIRELLLNVIKHAGVKSAELIIKHENGYLRIIVRDRGAGFHPEDVWRNANSAQKFGLISIRERLLHLGGRFEIESAPDEGSTVSLVVPLEEKRSLEAELRDLKDRTPEGAVSAWAGTSFVEKIGVMLVDDHRVMREGLSRMLGSYPDIEVLGQASDGEEAVHLARELGPDVILMDIAMPKMDGLEATQIIHSEFPHIRIIGLSMYDEKEQANSMIAAGACAYRSKDGDTNLLLSAIRGEE